MIINNVYNESQGVYKSDIENIIIQIESLRGELNDKILMGVNNNKEVLELSRELDELIVKYFKVAYEK